MSVSSNGPKHRNHTNSMNNSHLAIPVPPTLRTDRARTISSSSDTDRPEKPHPCSRTTLEVLSKWAIYAVVMVFLCVNTFALLNRVDTIYFLRIYQLIVACIMLTTSFVMIEFMIYARRNLAKLNTPHTIPRPMLISSLILTAGIVLGYAYFIVFNLTFQDCDQLVDAINPQEVWLDIIYEIAMILFCILAFVYLLQRSYYGAVNFHSDRMRRLWINATVCIAWIQVVVYKGYLSHQGLCQRKELSGYWCPVIQRYYNCDTKSIKGTRQIWYYLNKGLLNSTVIACASEFFPVVLVAHWLVCGGAEERAEDLIRKQRQKKSVRRVLQRFMTEISRVYGAKHKHVSLPPLRTAATFCWILIVASAIVIGIVIFHWFVMFYYTILFDELHKTHWMVDEYVGFVAGTAQIGLHSLLYFWATRIEKRRFDAYHKAEARGDVVLVFGCCALLSLKFALQFLEMSFQTSDGFITTTTFVLKIISLFMTICSQWFQFFSLRRILALSDRDVNASRQFLPVVAIAAFIANAVYFALTFFDTTIIKYQISHEEDYGFSTVTLTSMIITQTIYPADYLYAFTVAGCWMDLIYRYSRMGYFQLGKPVLDHAIDFDNHSLISAVTLSRRNTERSEGPGGHRYSLPTISVQRDDSTAPLEEPSQRL